MPQIREPKKSSSIDKKNRIIEAGLKLFGEIGYYNTNTAEIAKAAGVSTGIVYNYFMDKKDILMYAIDIYFEEIFEEFMKAFKNVSMDENYKVGDIFSQLLPAALKSHSINTNLQKQMLGLSYLDDDVRAKFKENEKKMVDQIITFVSNLPINQEKLKYKAVLSYAIIEAVCNELVYKEPQQETRLYIEELVKKLLASLFLDK